MGQKKISNLHIVTDIKIYCQFIILDRFQHLIPYNATSQPEFRSTKAKLFRQNEVWLHDRLHCWNKFCSPVRWLPGVENGTTRKRTLFFTWRNYASRWWYVWNFYGNRTRHSVLAVCVR